jgi:hypothetical protein
MRGFYKILILGGGVSGLSLATYKDGKIGDGSFDIYNIGAARFGRAAITVSILNFLFCPTLIRLQGLSKKPRNLLKNCLTYIMLIRKLPELYNFD